jgi:hypothetical protein
VGYDRLGAAHQGRALLQEPLGTPTQVGKLLLQLLLVALGFLGTFCPLLEHLELWCQRCLPLPQLRLQVADQNAASPGQL